MIPVGIHKGGDLLAHLAPAEGLLRGDPMYEHPPRTGLWWPPLALLVTAPFALLAHASVPLAKATFTLASVALLAWSVRRLAEPGWRPVLLGLAAVFVPLQTNFEDLNWNTVLLALVLAAVGDLEASRERRAGLWIGIATALKLFPGLLLLYLAWRRHWRGAAVGALVAVGLTLVALAPYGGGAVDAGGQWLSLTVSRGFGLRGQNQSLAALVDRLGGTRAVALGLDVVALAAAALALEWRRRRFGRDLMLEVAAMTVLAALVSPIAWRHYFLLALPAWCVVLGRVASPPWPGIGVRRAALWVAAFLMSGVWGIWSTPLRRTLHELAPYTFGALLLLAALVASVPRGMAPGLAHPDEQR